MDIKVNKFSEESTIGAVIGGKPHDDPCVGARFYAFPNEGERVKVDWKAEIPEKREDGWEPDTPDFAEIAKAFKAKGVSVSAKDLQKVFED